MKHLAIAIAATVVVISAALAPAQAEAHIRLLPNGDDQIQQWAQLAYARSDDKGYEGAQNFFSLAYNFDISVFDAFAGIQFTKDVRDLTLDGDWWPFHFSFTHGLLRLGVEAGYHVEWYSDISCEHDLLFSSALDWHSVRHYLASVRAGGFVKLSKIYAIDDGTVNNWNWLVMFSLGKQWDNGIEVRLDAGTRSLYRIPVFGTAFFTPSIAYAFREMGTKLPVRVRVGLEAEIEMRDWLAVSYYLAGAALRFTGRVCF